MFSSLGRRVRSNYKQQEVSCEHSGAEYPWTLKIFLNLPCFTSYGPMTINSRRPRTAWGHLPPADPHRRSAPPPPAAAIASRLRRPHDIPRLPRSPPVRRRRRCCATSTRTPAPLLHPASTPLLHLHLRVDVHGHWTTSNSASRFEPPREWCLLFFTHMDFKIATLSILIDLSNGPRGLVRKQPLTAPLWFHFVRPSNLWIWSEL
jgi:hypothetical protein